MTYFLIALGVLTTIYIVGFIFVFLSVYFERPKGFIDPYWNKFHMGLILGFVWPAVFWDWLRNG